MSGEQWRPVVGWEGCYEVSDSGRVRSVPGHGRGRVLRSFVKGNGYVAVNLHSGSRGSTQASVHRLVAAAFHGAPPDGAEACHNDGNRTNNRASNLRWDSTRGNARDRWTHGTDAGRRKTHCPRGHRLDEPNLKTSQKRLGWRACLSCEMARNRKPADDAELRAEADRIYAELMAACHVA